VSSHVSDALEQALALCAEMQAHAEAHEWELVSQLERRRRELVAQAVTAKPANLGEGLQQILVADARIKAVAEAARRQLVEELARSRAAHKAAQVYKTVER
jgi:hypothetical protein